MRPNIKKIIQISSLSFLFLFIIIYAFFRTKALIFGVQIKDVNIVNGSKIADSVYEIKGNAKNAIFLTLNGRIISLDQAGNFDETIALLSGYNVIEIKAEDKFGNIDDKIYKLMH